MTKYLKYILYILVAAFLINLYQAIISPILHAVYYEACLGNDERSVSILVEALGDDREVVRAVVVTQLTKRDCLDQLIEHGLSNSNARTKEGAAFVFVGMAPRLVVPKEEEQKLRTELRRNMEDADPLVSVQSARACWAIFRDNSVLPVYLETFDRLDMSDSRDRRACNRLFHGIWELRSDGKPATEFLRKHLQSEDKMIQSWAGSALRGVEDPKIEFFGD